MTTFSALPPERLVQRLDPPSGRVRVVMDTDTYNEIDDQFAVAFALLSGEKLDVEALYAAPFCNERSEGPKDGMEKSYKELLKIRSILKRERILVYRGAERYLPDAATPADSEAARDLVARALASDPDEPLYVVAIGAITNIASALFMEPRIVERIVLVWLGGHALHWPDTKEFNLVQDPHASRIVFDSGVPLVLVLCMGVASHLQTTLSEIRDCVKDRGEIGAYLHETYRNCSADHFGYSRVIRDIAAVAYQINPDWTPSVLAHSPRISDDFRWSVDPTRHLIRYVYHIRRDDVFKDLFRKLAEAERSGHA